MTAVVSWYGPLIDLSAAASHVGGFVQILARRSPRPAPSDNIKVVEFRNGLEGKASQISAVQLLLNSKDLMNPEGIDELISSCKVGDATRSKLRRVAEYSIHNKCALRENHDLLQIIWKNWKESKEKESTDFLSISELLSQSKLSNMNVYACIGKMLLVGSPTSHFKGHLSVIGKHSFKEHNDIVRDFITARCKLCGSPLNQKNLNGESTFAIDCPNNPKYLHVLGQIYKPFMIYVYDQSGQVPLLVRNKAAEILLANIIADDVSACYKSHQCMLLETYESGNFSASGMIDGADRWCWQQRDRKKEKNRTKA